MTVTENNAVRVDDLWRPLGNLEVASNLLFEAWMQSDPDDDTIGYLVERVRQHVAEMRKAIEGDPPAGQPPA